VEREGSLFFFEKKNQKTFVSGAPRGCNRSAPEQKRFLVLFFKKEQKP
jgi:hypothetical protein